MNQQPDNSAGSYEQLEIDTPENVLLNAEIAGYGSRCVAAMIDYLIIALMLFVTTIVLTPSIFTSESVSSTTVAVLVLFQAGLLLFYHLFFEFSWNGQTPGKRMLGLRVIMVNGLPLTTSAALIRNFVRLFDFLPILYCAGLIALFVTKRTQRLGDLAANTVVIREQRKVTLASVQETTRIDYHFINRLAPVPSYIDTGPLDETDRYLVLSYLRGRAQHGSNAGAADAIAGRVARKMFANGLPAGRSLPTPEIFLEYVGRAIELSSAAEGVPRETRVSRGCPEEAGKGPEGGHPTEPAFRGDPGEAEPPRFSPF